MAMTLPEFVARWQGSGAEERANKDLFFAELYEQALGYTQSLGG